MCRVWNSVDYALDWPAELMAGELVGLMTRPYRGWSGAEVELLLREAFHTEVPARDFARLHEQADWDNDPAPTRNWVTELLGHPDQLRPHRVARPYWAGRQTGTVARPPHPEPATAPERFADMVRELHAHGYLDREFARPCLESDPDQHHAGDLDRELAARLGSTAPDRVWPLQPGTWDTDTFYSLIEIVHDLVARPRHRWDHPDHGDCGPHFDDFETEPGRRIYRALVNRLLDEHAVALRLADRGEDEGRLIRLVDAARNDLIERARLSPAAEVSDPVDHAIALFRSRDATTHNKRSAIVALANVLEDRRALLKTHLFTSDEGALFQIANQFDLRHRNDKQHTDYDPAERGDVGEAGAEGAGRALVPRQAGDDVLERHRLPGQGPSCRPDLRRCPSRTDGGEQVVRQILRDEGARAGPAPQVALGEELVERQEHGRACDAEVGREKPAGGDPAAGPQVAVQDRLPQCVGDLPVEGCGGPTVEDHRGNERGADGPRHRCLRIGMGACAEYGSRAGPVSGLPSPPVIRSMSPGPHGACDGAESPGPAQRSPSTGSRGGRS